MMKRQRGTKRHHMSPGFIAWALHRVTGVLLGLYLFLHIWVIHHLAQGQAAFDRVMSVVQSPMFHILEIGLLGAVLFHGINGIRVVLVESGVITQASRMQNSAYVVLGICLILTLVGAVPFVRLALGH